MPLIHKAFKYRIYPDEEQHQALAVQFGHARWVYNHYLDTRIKHYRMTGKGLTYNQACKDLTFIKNLPETAWLKEANAQVLQQKLKDLDQAYTNFFEGRAKYPTFKKKDGKQSIRYPQDVQVVGKHIRLSKVGLVKIILHRPIEGEMKNVTVSKTKSGKYFASIQVEMEIDEPVYRDPKAGIDLGITHFATISSDGEIAKVDNPKWLRRSEKQLAGLQKKLARQQKGSNGYAKTKHRIALLHERIANQRKDFLHKLSYNLVKRHGYITIESLNVQGMVKNHKLAKSISDAGWSMFAVFLDYKGDWYGSHLEKADRFYPSSKLCHVCGLKNESLKLHHRFWTCNGCGTEHDRDGNAATNLEWYEVPNGQAGLKNASGDCVILDTALRPHAAGIKLRSEKLEANVF